MLITDADKFRRFEVHAGVTAVKQQRQEQLDALQVVRSLLRLPRDSRGAHFNLRTLGKARGLMDEAADEN